MALGRSEIKITFSKIVLFVVLSLVFIQALALIIGGTWGSSIKLGPIFILLALSMASITSVALVKKLLEDNIPDKKDVFAIFLTVGISLFIMFLLRDFVPEIFMGGLLELQALLGF